MEKITGVSSTVKNKVDKLDVDKLIPVRKDLSKLRDVVKMMLLKRMLIKMLKDKIPDITNSATNTVLNAKINEVKNEMPNVFDLVITASLIAVENKMPNVSNLFKIIRLWYKNKRY